MDKYKEWLEGQIERCLKDEELQREHWAFCHALRKYNELSSCNTTLITKASWDEAEKITHDGFVYVRYKDLKFI